MSQTFLKFASVMHRLTIAICIASLTIVLVSMSANVLLRHGAGIGYLKLQDATLYAFGIFAVLAIPCALATARHVRVQPRSGETNAKTGKMAAGIGTLVLVLLGLTLLFYGWPLFVSSLVIGEGSSQIGGLAGYFIVKAALPLGALLILVQGIALWLRHGEAIS